MKGKHRLSPPCEYKGQSNKAQRSRNSGWSSQKTSMWRARQGPAREGPGEGLGRNLRKLSPVRGQGLTEEEAESHLVNPSGNGLVKVLRETRKLENAWKAHWTKSWSRPGRISSESVMSGRWMATYSTLPLLGSSMVLRNQKLSTFCGLGTHLNTSLKIIFFIQEISRS